MGFRCTAVAVSVIPCCWRTSRQLRPARRPSDWEALISRDTAPLWMLTARSGREPPGSSSARAARVAASRYHAGFDFRDCPRRPRGLQQPCLVRKLSHGQGPVVHRLGLELLFENAGCGGWIARRGLDQVITKQHRTRGAGKLVRHLPPFRSVLDCIADSRLAHAQAVAADGCKHDQRGGPAENRASPGQRPILPAGAARNPSRSDGAAPPPTDFSSSARMPTAGSERSPRRKSHATYQFPRFLKSRACRKDN